MALHFSFHTTLKDNIKKYVFEWDFPTQTIHAAKGRSRSFRPKKMYLWSWAKKQKMVATHFSLTVDLALTNSYLLYEHSLMVPNPMSNMSLRIGCIGCCKGAYCELHIKKEKIDSLSKLAAQTRKSLSQNHQKVIGVPDDVRYSNVGIHLPHENWQLPQMPPMQSCSKKHTARSYAGFTRCPYVSAHVLLNFIPKNIAFVYVKLL